MIDVLLIICLQITTIFMMPLQLQLLQPMLQPQQTSLQQQLLALQQLQALQKLNSVQSNIGFFKQTDCCTLSYYTNLPRPLLILLPNAHKNIESNEVLTNLDKTDLRDIHPKLSHGIEDTDSESIVIDAETDRVEREPPRAVLLVPNDGRFSIGDFISSIPFLPFEINVPDTISWIYNGISGIISGIGQSITYRPQTMEALESMNQNGGNLRYKKFHTRKVKPIMVMPLVYP